MIGIDIEKIERFKEMDEKKLMRIFTKQEIDYCFSFSNPTPHIAGIWCVKEAFIKALKIIEIPLKDIEVKHHENGAPYIEICKLKKYVTENNLSCIDISISHTVDTAIAIVQIL